MAAACAIRSCTSVVVVFSFWLTVTTTSFWIDGASSQLIESERISEYHLRNHTWPIQRFLPNTPGWRSLMQDRLGQIADIADRGDRYEGYLQTIRAAAVVPNFTEYGFGLATCPPSLTQALRDGIREGLPTARLEKTVEVIDAPEPPLFIDRPDLTKRVLDELAHYAEEWSGIELTPFRAYGFRLYQNDSQLTMHVDKSQTHVISFILHIDSSDDAEPWPIVIEDFHGRTHMVTLTPGDMLFYESSKCFHGRPRRLNGSWYSSLFVHYYPKHGWQETDHRLEGHYAIPAEWTDPVPLKTKHVPLTMVGTSLKEPSCPDDWCRTKDAIEWSGPGEEGVWIAPSMERFPFNPKQQDQPKGDEL